MQPASTNAWVDGKVGGVIDVKKVPAIRQRLHPSDPESDRACSQCCARPIGCGQTARCAAGDALAVQLHTADGRR
jgi:hypothetical protein